MARRCEQRWLPTGGCTIRVGLLLLALLPLQLPAAPPIPAAAVSALDPARPTAIRQQQLRELLRHDCGSCHGLTRRGGLGPPLTADRLQYQPAATLIATILDGRPGTPMPPWRGLLQPAEVVWLVALLQQGEEGPDASP